MSKLGMLVFLLVLCATPADAATRKACRAKVCRGEIELRKASCNFPVKLAFPGWTGQSCVIPTP